MAEKRINGRIVNKHDVESNWALATGFTPMAGEIIIYDIDSNYSYERMKIGDGATNVNALPFYGELTKENVITALGYTPPEQDTVYTHPSTHDVSMITGLADVATSGAYSDLSGAPTDADDFGIYVQDTEPTDAADGDIWIDTANEPAIMDQDLPVVTAADNGKVLMVVNGQYQLVDLALSTDANGVLSV